MSPWLSIIGLGAAGRCSLGPAAVAALDAAEVVVGAPRHHALAGRPDAERVDWPSPFDALEARLTALAGRPTAVLVTGDPLWFSAGARLAAAFGPEAAVFPQVSAFQLAAARMGWALAELDTLSLHGRPVAGLVPFMQPGAKVIALTSGADTPAEVARLLTERGYGDSAMTVFSDMETPRETRCAAPARAWSGPVSAFNTLCVDCLAGPQAVTAPRAPGLDDGLFLGDGTMTKREVRAVTLARLAPTPGALLWDVGAGCGSVAVEWMRAARGARAIAVEPRADRRAHAAANAVALGAPTLEIRDGTAPEALAGLPAPDAVFIGGGLSAQTVAAACRGLRPGGRLVANAVTLESEALLLAERAARGGALTRLQVSRAEPVGGRLGWRPAMPVTQWSLEVR